jgi:putative membrane protein
MPALILFAVALPWLLPAGAQAHHLEGALQSAATWSYDPWLLTPLYLTAIGFYVGTQRLWSSAGFGHGVSTRQVAAFWTGWVILALAITSPLHWLGERLFTAHMVEHELIMLVAAPLLAYARVNGALLWSLPAAWRSTAGRLFTRGPLAAVWRGTSHPATATLLHGGALWVWHMPALYARALENDGLHRLQHISFFVSSLLFWWMLFYGRGRGRHRTTREGISMACLFVTILHSGVLGALLTLSSRVWIPDQDLLAKEFGLTPLEDQELAGILMWIPTGLLYTGAGLLFANRWIAQSGLQHPTISQAVPTTRVPFHE